MHTRLSPEPGLFRRSQHKALTHMHENWPSIQVDLFRRQGLGRQETSLSPDAHVLLLNLRGRAQGGEDFIDGKRIGFVCRVPGTLSYIPPNHRWTGWDVGDATASYLTIAVEDPYVAEMLRRAGVPNSSYLMPQIGFKDPGIQFAAQKIAMEINRRDTASLLIVESQIASIFGLLLRDFVNSKEIVKGGLSPKVLNASMALIDNSLDQALSLTELASAAGMSNHHFCRAFKKSTGLPPHAFLAHRRLEKASEMLRNSKLSITEIAGACGYSSPSHFSSAFRQEMGLPPVGYRRNWNGG